MRTRILGLVAAVVFTFSSRPARALDAPHDQTFSTGQCDNCHKLVTVDGQPDPSGTCVLCHNDVQNSSLGFPWLSNGHQAIPGETGNQHNWSGYAQNKSRGARSPSAGAIAQKLVAGKLKCSTCHDIHASSQAYAPDSKHTSIPIGTPTAATSGTGQMTLTVAADASKAWRVMIQPGGTTFIISHDFQLATRTWFKYEGGLWVAAGSDPTGLPGKSFSNGAGVTLDDGVTTVVFNGAVAGDYWDFYVSYPFLRWSNVKDAFCYMCHAERVMTHVRVSGDDPSYRPDGSRLFSHPVNVALGANGEGYDRLLANVLDADGHTQTVGDGRTQNDLRLDAGVVRCTTCHGVHNANSNSLPVD